MNELWICVVGGESEDERIICKGNMNEIQEAVYQYEDEVVCDMDKYFMLTTSSGQYTFYSYKEFLNLFIVAI